MAATFLKVPPKRFTKDLVSEVKEDNVANGAAALAFYLMLSIFPGMIVLLAVLPFLPIPHLDAAIMDFLREVMPGEAANLFTGVVQSLTSQRQGRLLSFGILLTFWSASSGIYAIMQQLNITYDVKEGRSFLKARGTALGLTLLFGLLVIGAFGLIIGGGALEARLLSLMGGSDAMRLTFAGIRWVIIVAALLLAFALFYYLGPDVEQSFVFITPGSVFGVLMLALASVVFKIYVDNFGNYSAAYGSLGAVIVLMLWLYITGLVILLGSEINALLEHYDPRGKKKGQKSKADEPSGARL